MKFPSQVLHTLMGISGVPQRCCRCTSQLSTAHIHGYCTYFIQGEPHGCNSETNCCCNFTPYTLLKLNFSQGCVCGGYFALAKLKLSDFSFLYLSHHLGEYRPNAINQGNAVIVFHLLVRKS